MKTKITKEEINNLNKYFRLVNYLSVGQLYLLDNPLLKRPLDIKDIKPNVVGHWGLHQDKTLYILIYKE